MCSTCIARVLQKGISSIFTTYKGSLFQVITKVIVLRHVGMFCKSLINHALLNGPERSKSLGSVLKWHL